MNFQKTVDYIKKHPEIFTIAGLCLVFYFLFFYGIGGYPLIDNEETKYAEISKNMINLKDFLTLNLNGESFAQMPPLFFWGESVFFFVFRHIDEFTIRFPVAVCASLSAFMIYFAGKKVISRRYGAISALIFATGLIFFVFSHTAISDMLLALCLACSVYSGFMTFFCHEKNKKFFWWIMYAAAAAAGMAKGIEYAIIPFITIFLVSALTEKTKEFFKPMHILPGILIFLVITLPWYLLLYKFSPEFLRLYLENYNLHNIFYFYKTGIKNSWFYYIPVVFVGLLPWSASFIAMTFSYIKNFIRFLKEKSTKNFCFDELCDEKKFELINIAAFVILFLTASLSSKKELSLAMPAIFPAAFLLGSYWSDFIFEDKHEKGIKISTIITNISLILAGATVAFSHFFLANIISYDIQDLRIFIVPVCMFIPLIGIISAVKKETSFKTVTFASYITFVVCFSLIFTTLAFNIKCKFGQDDLMSYAYAAKKEDIRLATFGFSTKYSVLYYYGESLVIQPKKDLEWIDKFLEHDRNAVIVKNTDLEDILSSNDKIQISKIGRKYSLIIKKRKDQN